MLIICLVGRLAQHLLMMWWGISVEQIELTSLKMVMEETTSTIGLVVVLNVQRDNSMVIREMISAWC